MKAKWFTTVDGDVWKMYPDKGKRFNTHSIPSSSIDIYSKHAGHFWSMKDIPEGTKYFKPITYKQAQQIIKRKIKEYATNNKKS